MSDIIQRLKDAYAENPAAALKLLPELFQAVDDGKIIELPCKVGDTLYDIFEFNENESDPEIFESKADSIEIGKGKRGDCFTVDGTTFYPDDFGKTVFLSREEAEKALECEK